MFYLKLTNSNKEKMIKSYELKKKSSGGMEP